ncbi:MAG: tRNA (adenosine(37)-N6)-dimethylallyltransferase MiaA [Deltaproteobacteria bacterium]|nr:tRNA (adenosine(37)-N6)-dimethylallyltransferase MiaA [Deltaproteobacteria bacterium]
MPRAASRGPLVLLGGPTASGKSAVALALAERVAGLEVVSADSQQVYRGFDIGTAKPTADERARLPHHAIDVVEPDVAFDAAAFVRVADEAIAAIRARGATPLVVGGTGLWMRALVRGLIDVPPADPAMRAELEAEVERLGAPAVHARLATLDAETAATVSPGDARRVVRALEILRLSGKPASVLRREHREAPPRHDARWVVVDPGKEALDARIAARVDHMLAAGLVAEVTALLARYPRSLRPFAAVGYAEVVAHVLDGVALDATRAAIVRSTRDYAKRQRTWFRKEPARWVRPDEAVELLAEMLRGP